MALPAFSRVLPFIISALQTGQGSWRCCELPPDLGLLGFGSWCVCPQSPEAPVSYILAPPAWRGGCPSQSPACISCQRRQMCAWSPEAEASNTAESRDRPSCQDGLKSVRGLVKTPLGLGHWRHGARATREWLQSPPPPADLLAWGTVRGAQCTGVDTFSLSGAAGKGLGVLPESLQGQIGPSAQPGVVAH